MTAVAMPEQWSRGPRPDPEVLSLLASLKEAAERGEIRSLAVVTLDPLLQVSSSFAGAVEQTGVRKRVLASGLIEVAHSLLQIIP